jgi:lipopolysaccharide transport system permease protein
MNELLIEPGRVENNYWRDLWRYRELFFILAWRDIAVRYKQTVVGVVWAVVRPFMTMLIFTVIFARVAGMHTKGGEPYALFVMAAMLPWQFFSTSLSESSNSLIGNANLISKVYFPRLIVPSGSVITSFVDFLITLALMAGMMVWFHFAPDWRILTLPLFVILAFGAAFGSGLWLCALNVEYRDFRYIIPFVVQFGLYVSPVGFGSDKVPEKWHLLYSINPMVGVIDGFRWALLAGKETIWWPSLATAIGVTLILCFSGIWYFRKMEEKFADVI